MNFSRDPETTDEIDHLHPNKSHSRQLSGDLVSNLVKGLTALSDANKIQGVPPPQDYDNTFLSGSFFSHDSSINLDDISYLSDISEIKEKNTELRHTAKQAVKLFRDTSKELLSRSILNSERKNELVNELENVKRVLSEAIFEEREKSIEECKGISREEEFMMSAHEQIVLIQKEIALAIERLGDTEELIDQTDKENWCLINRLKELDKSLEVVCLSEEEKEGGCKCEIF